MAIIATVMIVVVIGGGGAIGFRVSNLFLAVSGDWTKYHEVAHQKAIYLSDIRRAFGYGGFIHNFKNYVLRQDIRYLKLAERDMDQLKKVIAGYGALPVSTWESSALDRIETTIEDYGRMFDLAERLAAMGHTPQEMDQEVEVDDVLAIAALDSLETVWEQAQKSQTEHISMIVEEGLFFVNLAVVLVPILVLCGAVFFWLLRQLTALTAEKIHSEQRLQESESELRKLNDLKNTFLGIAAHDLRNPLGVIGGMSKMIMKFELGEERKGKLIETINRASTQMLALVNDLLDISAIESGKFTLKLKQDNITKLVEERVELMVLSAEDKGIRVATEFGDVPPVTFDRDRIVQVLDNLLSNAIKFSPANTTVHATVGVADGNVRIAVRDQGPGIPPDDRDRLFGTFEKLSAQPTDGEKSTGLGLAIVKKIVDAHSGSIIVDSEVGAGTTFTVALPLNVEAPDAP